MKKRVFSIESLSELELSDNALIAYERALAINPDLAEAWSGRGNVLSRFRRYDDALISFEKASGFKPDLDYLQGARLHAKLQLCDWRDFDGECAALVAGIRAGRLASRPFELLSLASSARDQLECARRFVDSAGLGMTTQFRKRDSGRHDRIHLAYVSADFREHPVSHLIAGVFENHDRARFETTAISLNPTDRSEMRTRLEDSFEHFIDASCDDAQGIARKMRELEVDIAVDLMGHTAGAKLAVFASRPCPIQVNYLGFAATMGASCIDYLIADRVAVPDDQWPNFSESVVCLPDTFMAYDTKLQIFRHPSARADHGLPETAFVFAAFNGSYKITPGVFDIWMQLLNAVDESVLWISRTNETAMRNLRREAEARGVAGTRLIFADRLVRMEDHLARHRLADLFLDTLPYNAHSTANDALWAGLPVLTCRGATFAGRVAASLLHAVGLPELVADSLAEYKALALKLARDPKLLAAIKVKLARNRDVHPLFDTARFTRHLEAAYTTMWEIYQRGETPKSFSVKPITMTTQ